MQTIDTSPQCRVLFPDTNEVRFCVVGCGGTGSAVAHHLAALMFDLESRGVTTSMLLIDHDTVEAKNVGRQRFAPYDVGHNKAVVLAQRLTAFYGVTVSALPLGVPDAWAHVRETPTIVVGCVDGDARRHIAEYVQRRNRVWWIDSGNDRFSGQVLVGNAINGEPPDPFGLVNWLPLPSVQLPGLLEADTAAVSADPLDCALAAALGEQSLFVNTAMATVVAQFAYDITVRHQLDAMGAYVSLVPLAIRPIPITGIRLIELGFRATRAHPMAMERENANTN
ncbi:MAG: PRTRC system ThiF family protein [Anaerolineae bacterium]|nr:PRTRC system ThiF family protein [Anaerolineae bacterium]